MCWGGVLVKTTEENSRRVAALKSDTGLWIVTLIVFDDVECSIERGKEHGLSVGIWQLGTPVALLVWMIDPQILNCRGQEWRPAGHHGEAIVVSYRRKRNAVIVWWWTGGAFVADRRHVINKIQVKPKLWELVLLCGRLLFCGRRERGRCSSCTYRTLLFCGLKGLNSQRDSSTHVLLLDLVGKKGERCMLLFNSFCLTW